MMAELRRRVASFFAFRAREEEFDRELAHHLELAAEENERQGMSPEAAREAARRSLGSAAAARERHRDARGLPWVDTVLQDLRYAGRTLRRDRGFTVIVIAVLALGIGANTAVFSIVNRVLLRGVPFERADELVWVENSNPRGGLSGLTYSVDLFETYRRLNTSYADMTAYFAFFGYGSYLWTGAGEPERLNGVDIAENFLPVLGVRPLYGRNFTHEECQVGGPPAILLGYHLWLRRFGGDPAVVGRAIQLNGRMETIVGVLPESFDFSGTFVPGARVEFVRPILPDQMRNWGNTLAIIGRLKPGVTVDQARAEVAVLGPRVVALFPNYGREFTPRLAPLADHISGGLRRPLTVLWGAVGVVLLIVCTNLSNLMLARASAREKELAIRAALGAGSGRLLRQLLTESLLLAGVGGGLGLVLAYAFVQWLVRSATISIALLPGTKIDGTAALFALGLTVGTGLLFGLLPALRIGRAALADPLREASRGSSSGAARGRLRSVLVVAEIGLACLLLVGAGLLLRSFLRVLEAPLGFAPGRAVSVRLDGPRQATPAQMQSFFRDVPAQLLNFPGIEAAGFTDALPLDRNRNWGLQAVGRTYRPGDDTTGLVNIVTPGYFAAMGIALREGRIFNDTDSAQAEGVAMINQTAARMHWPGESAVGRYFTTGGSQPLVRVVGVVGDVRNRGLEAAPGPEVYFPISQRSPASIELVVRTRLDATSLRAALQSVQPDLPLADIRRLDRLVDRAISPRQFLVALLGGFAGLALLLAALGIYGVIAYAVAQRRQEIGIRMALGATPAVVWREVIGQALALVAVGLVLGGVASAALARALGALLFETPAWDPLTFGAMAAVLVAAGTVAAVVPAWRAARIDPGTALRTS